MSGMGNFVPGLGIVGGALSMGSKVLNPAATINDVRREQVTIVLWEVNPLREAVIYVLAEFVR